MGSSRLDDESDTSPLSTFTLSGASRGVERSEAAIPDFTSASQNYRISREDA